MTTKATQHAPPVAHTHTHTLTHTHAHTHTHTHQQHSKQKTMLEQRRDPSYSSGLAGALESTSVPTWKDLWVNNKTNDLKTLLMLYIKCTELRMRMNAGYHISLTWLGGVALSYYYVTAKPTCLQFSGTGTEAQI